MRLLLIISILYSFSGFGQFGFDKIDHDFGDMYEGNDRVVDLKFRNTTPDKIYLLRIKHGREIKTLVSGQSIMPDSLLIIRFKYNPDKKGKFKFKIPIYLSNSLEPFIFTIEGNVRELDNTIGLACPSFDNPNAGGPPIFDFKGLVLDEETGEPIHNASITFISNGTISQIEETNRKGKVETKALIGLYYFVVDADGYLGKEFAKYVNRKNDSIVVYLQKPKAIEEEIIAENPVNSIDEDTVSKAVFEFPLDTIAIEKEVTEASEPIDSLAKSVFQFPLDTLVLAKEAPVEPKDTVAKEVSIFLPDTTKDEIALEEKPSIETAEPEPKPIIEIEEEKPQRKISYKSNNIVFLLDVSTSMNAEGKLDLLKASLIEMVNKLSERDKISLITYSTFSKVIADGVSAENKEELIAIIQGIRAQGMTAGGDGMKLAYRQGKKHFIAGGNNQVIMATDGKFNRGNLDLDRLVEKNWERGIGLTVLGIKNNPEDAESMGAIASVGGGRFLLIDSYEASRELLVKEIKRTSIVYE